MKKNIRWRGKIGNKDVLSGVDEEIMLSLSVLEKAIQYIAYAIDINVSVSIRKDGGEFSKMNIYLILCFQWDRKRI